MERRRVVSKKELSLALSGLKTFEKPKVEYEQYQTPSELAASVLWHVYMDGNIKNKEITDLGCGNGILGIGALLLGARKVTFVDADKGALDVAKNNKKYVEGLAKRRFKCKFLNKDVSSYRGRTDIVIENPPFGIKRPHIDKLFLNIAMNAAPIVYSFHKIESKGFIDQFARDKGYRVEYVVGLRFPLKAIFKFHRKKNYFVETGLWKIVKEPDRKV